VAAVVLLDEGATWHVIWVMDFTRTGSTTGEVAEPADTA
jgi:hypothetical protein